MKRREQRRKRGEGSLVLDNEALIRAATDRAMYVRLKAAHLDRRRVVTSAAILAELIRGQARDAGVHRVLRGIAVEPVTRDVGVRAGELIGAAGLSSEQSVDAMLAATAVKEQGAVLIITSDVPHLSALVSDYDQIAVAHVDKIT